MKLFTWSGGSLSSGFAVQKDELLGSVVFLGENGRGRHYEKISLYREGPAEIVNNRINEAQPVNIVLNKGTEKEKIFLTLAKATKPDSRVLVRIDTSWVYTRHTNGTWYTVAGSPQTLVSGYGAHGDAGRIGNWQDGIVMMSPGDVIKVSPEGGHKTCNYALFFLNGVLTTKVWADYEALTAMSSENGEGVEWL